MKCLARIMETFVKVVEREVPDGEDPHEWFEERCNVGAIDATEECDDFSRDIEIVVPVE